MKKTLRSKNFKILLFLIIISFSIYFRLFNHFYEQDEWMGIGHVKAMGLSKVFELGFLPAIIGGAGRPIAGLINYLFFTFFTFQAFPFALSSIILHALVAYSLFLLLEKFNKKPLQNMFVSLFFLINAVASQGVMWFSAAIAVELSTLLLIFSIMFFIDFDSKQSKLKYFLSILFFYLSFLVKESAVLFSIFFLIYILFENKNNFTKKIKYLIPYFIITFTALVRYLLVFINGSKVGRIITSTQGEGSLIKNIVFYPIKSISHFFISPEFLIDIHKFIQIKFHSNYYLRMFPLEIIILPNIVVLISVLLILTSIFIFIKNKVDRKLFIYGLVVYLAAILPYCAIKAEVFLESRYYYTPLIGIAIILSSIKFSKKHKSIITFFFLFILFSIIQLSAINSRLDRKLEFSNIRKKIVKQLRDIDLSGNKKNIILVETNNQDYIVPKQVLPFQQGIGYTFMVLYYDQGIIPNEFLLKNYLWDMGGQGLYEHEDYLFGFFVDEEEIYKKLELSDFNDINFLKININSKYEIEYDISKIKN